MEIKDINKNYHHGNLKETLIEEGINMIHENGIGNFSLRKLAKRVGVSATACYNHFENVDNLINAMIDYISIRFAQALQNAIKNEPGEVATLSMGKAYVDFFTRNPHYFSLLFDGDNLDIRITEDDVVDDGSFLPFQVFVKEARKSMASMDISESEFRDNLLVMWAIVHGFASMANMKGFHYDGNWGELVDKILVTKVVID